MAALFHLVSPWLGGTLHPTTLQDLGATGQFSLKLTSGWNDLLELLSFPVGGVYLQDGVS